jgi:hypothetical protein
MSINLNNLANKTAQFVLAKDPLQNELAYSMSLTSKAILEDLHWYRDVSSILMVIVLSIAIISLLLSFMSHIPQNSRQKFDPNSIEYQILRNRLKKYEINGRDLGNDDEALLISGDDEAEGMDFSGIRKIDMGLMNSFMKNHDYSTIKTNGITRQDLASLDGSSSGYSASALSQAMMSDSSSTCSRGSYAPR